MRFRPAFAKVTHRAYYEAPEVPGLTGPSTAEPGSAPGSFGKGFVESLVLCPNGANFGGVAAGQQLQAQADIVAGADLVFQPPDAMGIMVFMAGHNLQRRPRNRNRRLFGDRTAQVLVFGFGVAVGDIPRVDVFAPRAFGALNGSLQVPGLQNSSSVETSVFFGSGAGAATRSKPITTTHGFNLNGVQEPRPEPLISSHALRNP